MRLHHHRAGSGPPLLLIHGIALRWELWKPVLDRLEAEREVIAIDLPGFGDSPPPAPGTPPGPDSLSSMVEQFLDELGLDRPHVAGNSLGGWVGLELAKRGRVASVTGLSPAGFHNGREAVFERASMLATVRVTRLISPRVEQIVRYPLARKVLTAQYFAKPERIPPADMAHIMRGAAGATWFEPTLHAITSTSFTGGERIDVPVTIAWGQKDRLLLPRQAGRAARAIPHARVLPLAACGHIPMYDDPDRVAHVVLGGSAG